MILVRKESRDSTFFDSNTCCISFSWEWNDISIFFKESINLKKLQVKNGLDPYMARVKPFPCWISKKTKNMIMGNLEVINIQSRLLDKVYIDCASKIMKFGDITDPSILFVVIFALQHLDLLRNFYILYKKHSVSNSNPSWKKVYCNIFVYYQGRHIFLSFQRFHTCVFETFRDLHFQLISKSFHTFLTSQQNRIFFLC